MYRGEKVRQYRLYRSRETIEKTIRDMHIQEVDYFMEEFIPAYMKTLDELGKL